SPSGPLMPFQSAPNPPGAMVPVYQPQQMYQTGAPPVPPRPGFSTPIVTFPETPTATTSTTYTIPQPTTTMVTQTPTTVMASGSNAPFQTTGPLSVLTSPGTIQTTVVTYGPGTIFQVPSHWTLKQSWGWGAPMYIKDEFGSSVFCADSKYYSSLRQ